MLARTFDVHRNQLPEGKPMKRSQSVAVRYAKLEIEAKLETNNHQRN